MSAAVGDKSAILEMDAAIQDGDFSELMSESALAYMWQTIMLRSLPDVRDGMKPVHRRIAYELFNNFPPQGGHKKSAKIVGNVMGTYHPHGDSSIYEAMTNLGQPWTINFPVVSGQGNFGSADGDSPAAMRYTEACMSKGYYFALSDLKALDPKRPEMIPTYDHSGVEPSVLPVRFPAILVNPIMGIAVGLATSIPQFNLGEVCDATIAVLLNPEISDEDLFKIIPGPDFPSGGNAHDIRAIHEAMRTGRGAFPVTGTYEIVEEKKREIIRVTSLPYKCTNSAWIVKLAELNKEKKISLEDIRDRSKGDETLIDIIVKPDANASVILNTILRHTILRSSCSFNGVVIHNNHPQIMGVPAMLRAFCEYRTQTVFSRIEYELNGYRDEMRRMTALWIARYDIDNTIAIIRGSANDKEAVENLAAVEFVLAEHPSLANLLKTVEPDHELPEVWKTGIEAAKIIIERPLKTITALEIEKVTLNIKVLRDKIEHCQNLLDNDNALRDLIINELTEIKQYATPRKTVLHPAPFGQVCDEDLIIEKQILITMTERGFIKAVDINAFDEQKRGGVGRKGMPPRDDDAIVMTWTCSNKDTLLVFTQNGHAFAIKAFAITETQPQSQGRYISNFLPEMDKDDKVCSMLVKPQGANRSIVFVTSAGTIRRNSSDSFDTFTVKGKQAMKLPPQTSIVSVLDVEDGQDIMLYSSDGRAIRTNVNDSNLRVMNSRASIGVGGMTLQDGATVLGAIVLPKSEYGREDVDSYIAGTLPPEKMREMEENEVDILTVTQNGYGKRFSSHCLQAQNRNGQGVLIGRNKAPVVLCRVVAPDDSLSITTDKGVVIRVPSTNIAKYRDRVARGVTLLKMDDGAKIVDCSVIPKQPEEDKAE